MKLKRKAPPAVSDRRRPARIAHFIRAVSATAVFANLAIAAAAVDIGWTLRYVGHSTNEVMSDSRIADTLRALLPGALLEAVELNLGGPPGPVLGSGPIIVLSACRPHDCGDKAFLWIDASAGTALAATVGCSGLPTIHRWSGCEMSLGSLAYTSERIPAPARRALTAWLEDEDMEIMTANFIGRDGNIHSLDAAAYRVPNAYRALPTGPSFDCTTATSSIDRTICADSGLSSLDLKLVSLYDEIRRGTSVAPARDQLRDLQRGWLRRRNQVCGAMAGRTGCLDRQYQYQIDTLERWIPAR